MAGGRNPFSDLYTRGNLIDIYNKIGISLDNDIVNRVFIQYHNTKGQNSYPSNRGLSGLSRKVPSASVPGQGSSGSSDKMPLDEFQVILNNILVE